MEEEEESEIGGEEEELECGGRGMYCGHFCPQEGLEFGFQGPENGTYCGHFCPQ